MMTLNNSFASPADANVLVTPLLLAELGLVLDAVFKLPWPRRFSTGIPAMLARFLSFWSLSRAHTWFFLHALSHGVSLVLIMLWTLSLARSRLFCLDFPLNKFFCLVCVCVVCVD